MAGLSLGEPCSGFVQAQPPMTLTANARGQRSTRGDMHRRPASPIPQRVRHELSAALAQAVKQVTPSVFRLLLGTDVVFRSCDPQPCVLSVLRCGILPAVGAVGEEGPIVQTYIR
jgi:hypothetical protein